MQFEEIYEWTGTCGVYQVCIYIAIFTISLMENDAIGLIFSNAPMPHFCQVPELSNVSHAFQKYIAIPGREGTAFGGQWKEEGYEYSQCEMFAFNYSAFQLEDLLNWNRSERTEMEPRVVQCSQWIYEQTTFSATTVSRFDLVCSNEYLIPLITISFMCGLLMGGILSGTTADRFGRKKAMAIFMFIRLLGMALSTASLSYAIVVIGRFIIGVGLAGVFLSVSVIAVELVQLHQRAFIIVGSAIALSIGMIGHTVIAYFIRDDFKYQLAIMLPNIFLLFYLPILPESLRWLIFKGRHEEAETVIRRYVSINRRSLCSSNVINTKSIEMVKRSKSDGETTDGQVESAGSLLRLIHKSQLTARILIMNITMFTTSIMFFALLLNVGTLAGDIYVNTIVSGALEIPAKIVGVLLLDSKLLGRRLTNAGLLLLMTISSFICVPLILTGAGTASTAVSLAGKAIATISFTVVNIYTAELFPTQIRSVAIGTTSLSGRIGGMVVPYMGLPMIRLWKPLPFLIFGVLGTVSGLLGLLLPETLGQSLLDTVEQAGSKFESDNSKRVTNSREATGETIPASPDEDNSAAAAVAAGRNSTILASALQKCSYTSEASNSEATSDNSIKLADNDQKCPLQVNGDSDKAEILSGVTDKSQA